MLLRDERRTNFRPCSLQPIPHYFTVLENGCIKTKLLLELLEGKYIEELDMGLKYCVFTNFMNQSLILTSYKKLLIL